MEIKNTNIMIKEKERILIKRFFDQNLELFNDIDWTDYKNVELLTILYEHYLNENNLKGNDIMMLFLAELKVDVLSYKITKEKGKNKYMHNITIEKWLNESMINYSDSNTKTNNLNTIKVNC